MEKAKLLIVDDIEMNRRILDACFRDEFLTLEAANGEEALAIAQREAVDAVITDIFMDGMDGYALIRALRAREQTARIPMIAITESDEASQLKAMLAGANAFVARPFDGQNLRQILSRLMARDMGRSDLINFDYILDSLPGVVLVYKIVGDEIEPLFCSRGVRELTGRGNDEFVAVLKDNPNAGAHPADAPHVREVILRAARTHADFDITYRALHKSGETLWVWMQGHYIGQEDGAPLMELLLLNVSRSTRMYQDILDQATAMITVIDAQTYEILYANRAAVEATAEKPGEYVGSVCYRYIHGLEAPCSNCLIRRADASYDEREVDYGGRSYRQLFKLIRWNTREALMEYSEDITLQKQNAAYAENENNALRSILNHLQVGVYVFRFAGEQLQLLEANPAICAMMGVDPAKTIGARGETVLQFCHPDDRSVLLNVIQTLQKPDAYCDFTYRTFHREKNAYLWLQGRGHSVGQPDGSVLAYIGYNDVTEQKRLDAQVREDEQSLRAAIDHNHLDFWTLDLATRTVVFPASVAKRLNVAPVQEDYPEPILRSGLVHPDDAALFRESVSRACAGEHDVSWECRARYADDNRHYLWMQFNSTLLTSVDGEHHKAVFTARVIQSQKRLEQYYLSSERQNDAWSWELDLDRRTLTGIGLTRDRANWPLGEIVENVPQSLLASGVYRDEASCKALRDLFENAIKGVPYGECELNRWSEPHHSYRWYRSSITAVDDGSLSGSRKSICISRDVTAEKLLQSRYQLELETRRNQAESMLFSTRVNLSRGVVEEYWQGASDRLTPEIAALTDLRDRAALTLDNLSLTDEELARFSAKALTDAYLSGTPVVEADFRATERKTGNRLWLHERVRLLSSGADGEVMAFCYAENITDRVMTRRVTEHLTDSSYDFMGYVVVATGHYYRSEENEEEHTFAFCGDCGQRMAAFARAHVPEDEQAAFVRAQSIGEITRRLQTQSVYRSDYHYRDEDGGLRSKQMVFTYSDDTREFVILAQLDNTDLLADAEKRRLQLSDALTAARDASRAKTDFLSNMSHEIRTPLNAILGMTRLAQDETGGSAQLDEYLRRIDDSGQYLLGVINDILDMSRIESGRFTLNKEWVSPAELVKACVDMIAPQMKQRGITFECPSSFGNAASFEYYVDMLKTQQMLMNLLNNACKFTPEGGHVALLFRNLRVDYDACTAEDEIVVRDDGCGMSEDFLKRIFTPFEQERNRYTGPVQGTGLGLALARNIARATGGDITVTSRLGEGSAFTIRFPYRFRKRTAETALAQREEQTRVSASIKGLRVLMAEDHPLNAAISQKLLEKAGVVVTLAPNGRVALDTFAQAPADTFDAILMDVRMPVMNGVESARAIRALDRPDAKTIPIIAMTANAFDEDRKQTREAGMNAHLAKPVDPDLLYRTLAQTIAPQSQGGCKR